METTRETARWHRPLMVMVAAMTLLVVVAGIGLAVDDRILVNESIWAKPLKFGVSFVIYGLTLAWLIPRLTKARRTMWTLGTLFAVTGVVDVGFIALQAARGTFSHFNVDQTDPINVVGQQVFQSGVIGLFGVSLVIAVMMLWQRVGDAALTRALRNGITLAVAGMAVAFGIASTAPERISHDAYGHEVPLAGGHGVGVPDGGGMPITNWSTVGGDLRVPHFIGLHAVQVFVLVAVALAALAGRVAWLRSERVRARLVGAVVLGYGGVFAVTTWQAFRGQSFVAPDAATLTAFGAVAAVSVLCAALVVWRARRAVAPVEPVAEDTPTLRLPASV